MRDLHVLGCLCVLLSAVSGSRITLKKNAESINFLEKSCADITQIVLKSIKENDTNFIFAPFGYSVILGILSEGADGTTKDELERVLHLPNDINLIRKIFKQTLERLQDKSQTSTNPQFKNYFYVYKNFTVEDHYKSVLLENYFTDVKSVERPSYDEDFDSSPTTEYPTSTDVSSEETSPATEKESTTSPVVLVKRAILIERNSRRTRFRRLARRYLGIDLENKSKGEVSSLSTNRLSSGNLTKSLSRMIIFNGLYFKGLWKVPFQYKEGEEPFYTSQYEKIDTKTMFTVGQFSIGNVPEIGSTVLSIPYKGERYSFVIILPNERDGIHGLLSNLTEIELSKVISNLEPRHIQLTIPSFEFKTISYLRKPLSEIGIGKIFTREANFDYISKNSGLFVDDIVQLVTINVDNDAGTPNFLTASAVQTRTVSEKFSADHPFAFFIVDQKENLIIASGVLHKPSIEKDD